MIITYHALPTEDHVLIHMHCRKQHGIHVFTTFAGVCHPAVQWTSRLHHFHLGKVIVNFTIRIIVVLDVLCVFAYYQM